MAPTADSKVIQLTLNAKETDVRKLATTYTQSQFFTSDTDAWIVFGVPDLDLTGATATLKITNTTEGTSGSVIESILEPELIEEVLYFCFEMSQTIGEDSPIRHAGTWLGQIYITKAGKDLTTHKFVFSVDQDLMDTDAVGLILVQSFNVLMSQLDQQKTNQQQSYGLMITDIQDAETARNTAESARDTAETGRSEAEQTRGTAETTRGEQEAQRVQAEAARKSEFNQLTTITDADNNLYKWHFSLQDGVLVFNYEEVI